jgi:uncharacterized membrane protein
VTGRTLLIAVEILAASIWVGSLVCLALVARIASRDLDAASRVTLFRGIGRIYGIVGTAALVVAIGAGVVIASPISDLGRTGTAVAVLAGVLVVATVAGMVQARRMTASRRRAIEMPEDERAAASVRRGAALAGVLRGSIALLTLVIVVLGADLLDR